jgi:hypothetical protein
MVVRKPEFVVPKEAVTSQEIFDQSLQLVLDKNTQTEILDVLQKPLPELRPGFSEDKNIRMDSVPMIF